MAHLGLVSFFLLKLQEQMKDVHVSEIIDVYEQKISALAVRNLKHRIFEFMFF